MRTRLPPIRRMSMPDKPKVAFYWCASCGGCEESIVDLAEDILGVVAAVDIMFWPVAMDFKKSDVEAIPDGGLLVAMINGASGPALVFYTRDDEGQLRYMVVPLLKA